MTDTILMLVLYVIVVARITRFINFDVLFDRPRIGLARMFNSSPKAVYFLTCPWCISVWVALACVPWPLFFADNRVLLALGLALAASHITGISAPLSSGDVVKVEYVDEDADDED